MRRIAALVVLATWGCAASAALTLYAFGPDADGVGRVFTPVLPTAPGVALGDGGVAFNGGLGFLASTGRFYAIENDALGNSALTSFSATAPSALAAPLALGAGFYGGLAVDSGKSTLYAIASDAFGVSSLYRIDLGVGATALGVLGSGYYGGLAFNSVDGELYAISGDDFGVQRRVSRIDPDAAGGPAVTALFDLGDGSLAFQGGLVFDALAAHFVVIGNDAFADSALYSFTGAGATSLVDLAAPVGVGFINVGLTFGPDVTIEPVPTPEPAAALLLGIALPLLGLFGRRVRRHERIALPVNTREGRPS